MSSHGGRGPAVMHVIDTGGPGGAETVFATLVTDGARRGINAAVIVPYDGWLAGQLRAAGAGPTLLRGKGSLAGGFLLRLAAVAVRSRASILHAHLIGASTYCAAVGLLLRRPVVAVFHGGTDVLGKGRLASAKRWLLGRAHVRVVAVSEAVRDALATWGLPADRILLIPNGVDVDRYVPGRSNWLQEQLRLPCGTRLVGAVGNLRPAKSYEMFVEAACLLSRRQQDVHFVIVGSGSETDRQRLLTSAAAGGLTDRLHMPGFLPSSAELFQSLTVLVSSSRSEGMPLNFLEAMACGIPIVATNNEGAGPLLRDTGAGLLSPVADPVALADNIERALCAPVQAQQLGQRGRTSVCERFSVATTLGLYRRLYDELSGSPAS